MLSYTLSRILERQQAVIERDVSGADEFGNRPQKDWQPLGDPVPCIYWWRKEGTRGPGRKYATAQREITLREGGMIVPPGTDITDRDRISQIIDPQNPDADAIVQGPLEVNSVFDYGDHIEVSWIAP